MAYDQAKQIFLANGMPDNVPTHILSGLSAGLAATLLGSPVDVIKVRSNPATRSCTAPSLMRSDYPVALVVFSCCPFVLMCSCGVFVVCS